MIPYLIHVSVLTAVLFLAYRILLSSETFFAANRYVLLGGVLSCFLIPLVSIPSHWSIHDRVLLESDAIAPAPLSTEKGYRQPSLEESEPIRFNGSAVAYSPNQMVDERAQIEYFSHAAVTQKSVTNSPIEWSAPDVLRMIYTTGLCLFCLLFLVQLMRLAWMYHKGEKRREAGLLIVENSGNESSFSFWSYVFINKDAYDQITYDQILDHERIHIQSRHSLDMLIAELFVIVQWYNPFAWMYKKAIDNNLEYLTDQKMLRSGADRQEYQLSLVRVAVPDRHISLSNYYNQSSLKKRIIMMNHKKSTFSKSWKYLLILPLIAFSMFVLNEVRAETHEPDLTSSDGMDPLYENTSEALLPTEEEKASKKSGSTKANPLHTQASLSSLLSEKAKSPERVLPVPMDKVYSDAVNDTVPPSPPAPPSPPRAPRANTPVKPPKPPTPPSAPHPMVAPSPHAAPAVAPHPAMHSKLASPATPSRMAMPALPAPQALHNHEGSIAALVPMPVMHLGHHDVDITSGHWEAKIQGDQRCITFTNKEKGDKWTWKSCDDGDFLIGIEKMGSSPFRFSRDAGTLVLKGKWSGHKESGSKGRGTYTFEPSQSFNEIIKSKGGKQFSDQALFTCFIHDVGKNYINMLSANGMKITEEGIIGLSIHGVDEDNLKEYTTTFKKVGLSIDKAEDIIAFQIHGVDPDYVADMYQQLGEIKVEEYVQMAIHGVDPEFAAEAKKSSVKGLTTEELIQMSIHGVDMDYIREMKESGIVDMKVEQLIQFAIHGVDPSYIAELKNAGLKGLSNEEIMQASMHGVDAEFIKDIAKAGLEDLSFEELLQMSTHGISTDLATTIMNYKFTDANTESIIQAGVHGMDVSYVNEMMKLGFENVRITSLIQLHIHGVDANDIEEARRQGHNSKDIESYLNFILHELRTRE